LRFALLGEGIGGIAAFGLEESRALRT